MRIYNMQTLNKEEFHRSYKKALKLLAAKLGFAPGTFDVRSNKGGDAVLGEVTLHSDTLYVQVGGLSEGDTIMYRSCVGRKDYVGGRNRYMKVSRLVEDLDGALAAFREAMEASGKEPRY